MERPPFTLPSRAINLIAEISAQIERYAIRLEQEDGLRLRKANRIKTIHSSLAIEGNKLTEGQVSDIIDGKTVVAPLKDIQEVKNALKTYELFPSLDPFKEEDLLCAHGVMMEALIDNPGHYRNKGVGVYSEKGLVHMAPSATMVPQLMGNLFEWLHESDDHLLIRSCVFHYEFEFIHPFMDGNGRMGRLWQSVILAKLHPLFQYLPVENMVYANQEEYYKAIAVSDKKGESGPFIEFMLGEILKALKSHQGTELDVVKGVAKGVAKGVVKETELLDFIHRNPRLSAKDAASLLGLSPRHVQRLFASLRDSGKIHRMGGRKNGYWEIIKN